MRRHTCRRHMRFVRACCYCYQGRGGLCVYLCYRCMGARRRRRACVCIKHHMARIPGVIGSPVEAHSVHPPFPVWRHGSRRVHRSPTYPHRWQRSRPPAPCRAPQRWKSLPLVRRRDGTQQKRAIGAENKCQLQWAAATRTGLACVYFTRSGAALTIRQGRARRVGPTRTPVRRG